MTMSLDTIIQKALIGNRLSFDEGVKLLEEGGLLSLGKVANEIKKRKHPENIVTFVIDRNINYTNICQVQCKFCAFYRHHQDADAYILSDQELFKKIQETIEKGGTQLLIQGGLHPELGLDYYLDLLIKIKSRFKIHIHSFSPPEVHHIAAKSGKTIEKVLLALKNAGLDSIPGGGAEILSDRVRKVISPKKISAGLWIDIMKAAHKIGLNSTATMMFGSVETTEERVEHLIRIREAQDETGGFTAFIPWSFQPNNTELGGSTTSGVEYLKMVAISRIMLDNINNVQTSWVTQGAKVAQTALWFGANDFGGTMLEENVVKAAGVTNRVSIDEIVESIKKANMMPVQRTTNYKAVKSF